MAQVYDSLTDTYDDAAKAYDVGFLVALEAFSRIDSLPKYEAVNALPSYAVTTSLPVYERSIPLEVDYF